MNERSDMDRVLSHWFADGPSEMPDPTTRAAATRWDAPVESSPRLASAGG